MRHRPAATGLHRQAGLGAVERLDLRFLIDRQHQRVLRRVQVEADDVLHLGGELRIVRQLEGPDPVRLQAVRRPDPLHAAMADPGRLGHRPASPVRRLARRFGERHLDDPFDRGRRQGRLAAGPGGLLQQAIDTGVHEALPASARSSACPCRCDAGSPSCRSRRRSAARSAPARHASVGCCPRRRRPQADRDLLDRNGLQRRFSSRQIRTGERSMESFVSANPLALVGRVLTLLRRSAVDRSKLGYLLPQFRALAWV